MQSSQQKQIIAAYAVLNINRLWSQTKNKR